jgi:transcription-repair coupling factor (superfamily II helicase)
MKIFSNLLDNFDNSQKNIKISGLTPTAISLLCASLAQKTKKSLLYVLDDKIDPEYIQQEILFFLQLDGNKQEIDVLKLPSKSSNERPLFFEKMLTDPDDLKKIVIVNNTSLLEHTVSKVSLSKNVFELLSGVEYKRETILQKFSTLGFAKQDEVYEKMDFSIRGEILDLWAIDSENPVRIVFNDDEIESIYEFDVTTQRRQNKIQKCILRNFQEENTLIMDYFNSSEYVLCHGTGYTNNTEHLFKNFSSIIIEPFSHGNIVDLKIYQMPNFKGRLDLFYKQLEDLLKDDFSFYIILHKSSEIENIKNTIFEKFPKAQSNIIFLSGALREGFISKRHKIAVLTEKEIFDRDYVLDTLDSKSSFEKEKKEIDVFKDSSLDYKIGDFVVHSNYGIGKFLGFNKVATLDKVSEYITIEYANNDKLYVPIYDFTLINKYSNYDSDYKPMLDTLDTITWKKTRRKIEQKIFEMASEIIAIQAKRKQTFGISFKENKVYENEFRDTFPYQETPDQTKAIIEVLDDMNSEYPMERLVCGDVGYGKTEVAIRAAFRAIMNAKQVVLIAPTTILAKQHFNTFQSRFSNYPVKVVMLSRFCTAKEMSDNKKLITDGKADIIISTHSVLRSSLNIQNLGLVIIDEEHRFGVKDKEKLKRLQKNVDILLLSATPIPRTLSMSLNGIKDISVIETPPPTRKEITTHIGEYDKALVKEAINFELNRDGQVFYIYNRIENMAVKFNEIQTLVPNAKIAVAHGQIQSHDLDEIMTKFMNKEYDILLATTIVESGLDIPAVNMMIIDGADRLGLAQMYQLRGRVGRGYEKAFCYVFYPENSTLNENAIKRLQAIQNFQGFGAGFKLALRDLEIRGAGNILGKKQHGYIKEIGFDLYVDMLNKAISSMGSNQSREVNTEINLNINAYIPDKYIPSPPIRMYFYKQFLNMTDAEEIKNIKLELEDRYGKIPLVLENLFALTEVRILAKNMGLLSIIEQKNKIVITIENISSINVDNLLKTVTAFKDNLKFKPENFNVIEIYNFSDNKNEKISLLKKILQAIG